jgi:Rrf2 family protein
MLITREADYAVRCVLYLAGNTERSSSAGEIARAMSVPKTFLAKILQKLHLAHLVASVRGAGGGYRLARRPEDVTLLDVVSAIQGPVAINLCAVEGEKCGLSSTCTVHPVWTRLRGEVEDELRKVTMKDLAS